MGINDENGVPELAFTHSIKLEPTAKGYRIHVHCYGNSAEAVAEENMNCIRIQEQKLKDDNKPIAPMSNE